MIVSVIIPVYNSEKTIMGCIKAINAQSVKPAEIIVVDDGSSDGTKKILGKSGVKFFSQKNSGPAKARNLGASKARGEILVFTDADCVPEKSWLEEMLAPFSETSVAGVQGAYRTKQASLTARFSQIEIEERYDRMLKSSKLDWLGSYSAAYRRSDFLVAGGFDESFPKASGEDPELSYRLAKSGKRLVFNPRAIVNHTHPDSLMKYLRVKYFRAFYRVNLYSKHSDKIASDSYTTPWIKFQILAGYGGLVFFLASIALYFFGFLVAAGVSLAVSTLLTALGAVSTLQFTFYAWPRDRAVAVYSLLVIPLRTLAFQLGFVLGAISHGFSK